MIESLNIFSSDPKHLNDSEYFYWEQWLRKVKKLNGMGCSSYQRHVLKALSFFFFGSRREKSSLESEKAPQVSFIYVEVPFRNFCWESSFAIGGWYYYRLKITGRLKIVRKKLKSYVKNGNSPYNYLCLKEVKTKKKVICYLKTSLIYIVYLFIE